MFIYLNKMNEIENKSVFLSYINEIDSKNVILSYNFYVIQKRFSNKRFNLSRTLFLEFKSSMNFLL